jgi:hypothetical protein
LRLKNKKKSGNEPSQKKNVSRKKKSNVSSKFKRPKRRRSDWKRN